jgi:glycine cleavage system regulatory protein
MTISLVLSFICADRPGLVNSISETIAASGGSWLESRLARLADKFAGIVLVSVPAANQAALTAALHGLAASGLNITVESSALSAADNPASALLLSVVGHDRPGIVRDVTESLTALGVNIDEFSSTIESAAFTGETMFRASARLHLPDAVTGEAVRQSLEKLADEIMVDLAPA